MAQFPTSAKSFTPRSDGQVISASHVQDLQDEVNAIEDGLLNGSARLNSSNSTLARLSVLNGSTLAGAVVMGGALSVAGGSTLTGAVVMGAALSVAGGSTLAGTLSVGGGSTFAGPVVFSTTVTFSTSINVQAPSVRVSLSADVEFSSATETCLNWDVQDWKIGSMHSTSVNSSRITFTESTGLYKVGINGTLGQANVGSHRHVRIRLNDTSAVCGALAPAASSLAIVPACASDVIRIQSTADYITAHVINQQSTGRAFANSTTYGPTNFWAFRVSI